MKKLTTCILFIFLGLAAYPPTVAHADAKSTNRTAQKNAKRMAAKSARQRKKDQKTSRKATADWKKHHHSGF